MGMPGGFEDQIRRDTDAVAAELLAGLTDDRRTENKAAAALVMHLFELGEFRFAAEAGIHDRGGEADVTRADRAVETEAAVALSLSRTIVRDMITVGKQLHWRMPGICTAFSGGDLDYPRVQTIALVLSKASDDTVRAIEADILASALRYSTKVLRDKIWAHWFDHDKDEANAARISAESEERCAELKASNDGMASLFAKMTALEGAECDSVLEEIAGTVCSRDPRTKRQLRGHALVALIHREDAVACLCGKEDCPVRGAVDLTPKRRPHLLQILISAESLLGLTSEPATLGDGTVLDPETARLIAGDARWQILLTEFLDAAKAQVGGQDVNRQPEPAAETAASSDRSGNDETGGGDRGGGGGGGESETSGETGPEPGPFGDDGPQPRPPGDTGPNSGSPGGPRAFRIIARGRTRAAAPLPTPGGRQSTDPNGVSPSAGASPSASSTARSGRGGNIAGREVQLSAAIAAFLAAAAEDPSLTQGIYPDGHGGFAEPPAGALTYRPSAELVALTRATHCTCTFPNCSVPATRCEIDHIVPFDHDDPLAGGWTIASNLQPLCNFHHQSKTMKLWAAAKLGGDGIFWTSCAGLRRVTPSTYGNVMIPDSFVHNGKPRPNPGSPVDPGCAYTFTDMDVATDDSPTEAAEPIANGPSDELYEPTWWETNIGEHSEWYDLINTDRAAFVPSLGDIARLKDPQEREDAIFLRERFLEHRAVVTARERYRPPPF